MLYLHLPLLLFHALWLRTAWAVPMVIAEIVGLILVGRGLWHERRSTPWPRRSPYSWLIAAALALMWLSWSGVGGHGLQNSDYVATNAMLKDLAMNPWPLTYGGTFPLVYYVGYFLPPAAAASAAASFGADPWWCVNAVAMVYCALGLALTLLWFVALSTRLAGVSVAPWAAILLFILASGLDIVGLLLRGQAFELGQHIEWWATLVQFSSNTTLLYWVPQHAIGAWIMTAIWVDGILAKPKARRGRIFACSAALLWTPFAVVGMVPFVLLGVLKSGLQVGWRDLSRGVGAVDWLLAPLVTLPVACYLTANAFAFPMGWVFTDAAWPDVWAVPLAIGLEVLVFLVPVAAWLLRGTTQPATQPYWLLFGASAFTLVLLPLARMGHFNDLVMRGTIPSLFVLWLLVAAALFAPGRGGFWRPLLLVVVTLGAATPLSEIARSVRSGASGLPASATVRAFPNLGDAGTVEQRRGRPEALFYRLLAAPPG